MAPTNKNTRSAGDLVRTALASKHLLGFDTKEWGANANAAPKNAGAKPAFVGSVCFAAGTLIRTVRGNVAVEELRVGEDVITASGAARAIVWLGHRTVDARIYSDVHSNSPVRISRDAFGPMRPERDLYVSPGHAICVTCIDEVLIMAESLVNGTTIARIEMDEVTYWHVELESHDILIANGLPTESYLEMGNRDFFVEEGGKTDEVPGGENRTHDDFCRQFISCGPVLEAVRMQLALRAAKLGWVSGEDAENPLMEELVCERDSLIGAQPDGLVQSAAPQNF